MLDDAPDIKMAMAYGSPPWHLDFEEPEPDYYEEEMAEEAFYQNRFEELSAEFEAEIAFYARIVPNDKS